MSEGSLFKWLKSVGLERYTMIFADNDVDLEAVRLLTESDLEKLGISLGHRKKLLKAIADLNGAEHSALAGDSFPAMTSAAVSCTSAAERRQLTVMFCDLVGSTALAQKLDPEHLRELMRAYQEACGHVVERYEGHVAQYLGDGLMIYFGWPRAHEDDAERAVRAGLEIIQAVKKVPASEPLAVRIGIATGPVVVGETGGGDASVPKLAVGETPNLAARLQGLSGPHQIVIAPATRRLLGAAFDYVDLGKHPLKGIVEPVPAFQILRAARTEGRFEATHGGNLIPLVGREEQIGLLLRRWDMAKQAEGQVVLLCGEPGIGKSRIIRALRERIADEPHLRQRYQCSPFHTNSALYPVIEHLERAAAFARDDSVEQKLDKLEALLREGGAAIPATAPLIATLLSLPAGRYPALNYSPQKHKEKTLEALSAQIEGLSAKNPVLMIFEDVHWMDPTTQEALDLIVSRIAQWRVLLIVTYRPEHSSKWTGQPQVTTMTLSRLSRRVGALMVRKVTGDKSLPNEVLDQILVKADGVPLFVEELTKATLESGLLKDCGDRYELTGLLTDLAIPSTLQDSLMARLDRYTPAKEVAQIGACIGREFPYELLSVVWSKGDRQLQEALDQLVHSELISCRGFMPDAVYTFKHALVQDAAYDSLLKTRRQELHGKIARVLEGQFPATKDTGPERLARHYTEASMLNLAIPYWIKAGQLALTRTALPEAIAHLETGQQLLDRITHTAERDGWELQIRSALGTAWWARKGWMAEEMVVVLKPALALAKALHRRDVLIQVLWGLWVYYLIRGRVRESVSLVEQALAAARESDDEDLMIVARMPAMVTYFWLGDLVTAKEHGDAILTHYDERRHWSVADNFNHDPKTITGIYGQHWLWMLGFPDQALTLSRSKDEHARRRNHPFDLAFALTQGAHIYDYLADAKTLAAHGAEAQRIGEERGMPTFEIMGRAMQGVGLLRAGDAGQAVPVLREAMDRWRATGARLWGTYINAILGEALACSGNIEAGLEIVNRMLAQIDQPDWEERSHLAEILRLKGWILSLKGDFEGAERNFLASLDWARKQQAKSWELRTSTSLAKLWQSQGKRKEAHELLAPIYNWFTEGFDTKDLKDAKSLLEELRQA